MCTGEERVKMVVRESETMKGQDTRGEDRGLRKKRNSSEQEEGFEKKKERKINVHDCLEEQEERPKRE
jgi:hypothetical protein